MNAELSDREKEVVALYARGMSASQVGAALGLSEKTIESHKKRIRTKLSIADRMQWMSFLRTIAV